MRTEALHLNRVPEGVLADIAKKHSACPEFSLFLQPWSDMAIAHLRDNPPDENDPVKLYISTADDIENVRYTADIIRWDDKTNILPDERARIEGILDKYQSTEEGLYNAGGGISRNLLWVTRMAKLDQPFEVTRLVKTSNGEPLQPNIYPTWAYVFPEPVAN